MTKQVDDNEASLSPVVEEKLTEGSTRVGLKKHCCLKSGPGTESLPQKPSFSIGWQPQDPHEGISPTNEFVKEGSADMLLQVVDDGANCQRKPKVGSDNSAAGLIGPEEEVATRGLLSLSAGVLNKQSTTSSCITQERSLDIVHPSLSTGLDKMPTQSSSGRLYETITEFVSSKIVNDVHQMIAGTERKADTEHHLNQNAILACIFVAQNKARLVSFDEDSPRTRSPPTPITTKIPDPSSHLLTDVITTPNEQSIPSEIGRTKNKEGDKMTALPGRTVRTSSARKLEAGASQNSSLHPNDESELVIKAASETSSPFDPPTPLEGASLDENAAQVSSTQKECEVEKNDCTFNTNSIAGSQSVSPTIAEQLHESKLSSRTSNMTVIKSELSPDEGSLKEDLPFPDDGIFGQSHTFLDGECKQREMVSEAEPTNKVIKSENEKESESESEQERENENENEEENEKKVDDENENEEVEIKAEWNPRFVKSEHVSDAALLPRAHSSSNCEGSAASEKPPSDQEDGKEESAIVSGTQAIKVPSENKSKVQCSKRLEIETIDEKSLHSPEISVAATLPPFLPRSREKARSSGIRSIAPFTSEMDKADADKTSKKSEKEGGAEKLSSSFERFRFELECSLNEVESTLPKVDKKRHRNPSETASLTSVTRLKGASPSALSALSMESAGQGLGPSRTRRFPAASPLVRKKKARTDGCESESDSGAQLEDHEAAITATPRHPGELLFLQEKCTGTKPGNIATPKHPGELLFRQEKCTGTKLGDSPFLKLSTSSSLVRQSSTTGSTPLPFEKAHRRKSDDTNSLLLQPMFASPMPSTFMQPSYAVCNKVCFSPGQFFKDNDFGDVEVSFPTLPSKASMRKSSGMFTYGLTSPITKVPGGPSASFRRMNFPKPPPLASLRGNPIQICNGILLENESTFTFSVDESSSVARAAKIEKKAKASLKRKGRALPTKSSRLSEPKSSSKKKPVKRKISLRPSSSEKKKKPLNVTDSMLSDVPRAAPVLAMNTSAERTSGESALGTRTAEALGWCKCKHSRCLKLYCDCFRNNSYCGEECNCKKCQNTSEYDAEGGVRRDTVEKILARRPDAFSVRVTQIGEGCSCKKNKCLKKYCACYADSLLCLKPKCKCNNCHNMTPSGVTDKGLQMESPDKSANACIPPVTISKSFSDESPRSSTRAKSEEGGGKSSIPQSNDLSSPSEMPLLPPTPAQPTFHLPDNYDIDESAQV